MDCFSSKECPVLVIFMANKKFTMFTLSGGLENLILVEIFPNLPYNIVKFNGYLQLLVSMKDVLLSFKIGIGSLYKKKSRHSQARL